MAQHKCVNASVQELQFKRVNQSCRHKQTNKEENNLKLDLSKNNSHYIHSPLKTSIYA